MIEEPLIQSDIRRKKRWTAMKFIILFVLGAYYSYNCPAELETAIKDELNVDTHTYSLLYSVYSLPNFFIPFIAGVLMDKYGNGLTLIVVLSALSIGQIVMAYGGFLKSFNTLVAGRALYGMGSETMYVL